MHSSDASSARLRAAPLDSGLLVPGATPPDRSSFTVVLMLAPPSYVGAEDCTDGWEDLFPDVA